MFAISHATSHKLLDPVPMHKATTGRQIISNVVHDMTSAWYISRDQVRALENMWGVDRVVTGEQPNFYADVDENPLVTYCSLGYLQHQYEMRRCVIVDLSALPSAIGTHNEHAALLVAAQVDDNVVAWVFFNDNLRWRQVL